MAGGRKLEVFIIGNASSLLGALAQSNAAAKGFQARMAGTAAGMAAFGKKMTTHVTLPLVALGVVATEMAEDFDRQMTKLSTSAGAPVSEIERLHDRVLDLTKDPAVTQGPKELAEGLYFIESAGFRGSKAMNLLKLASHGATVGNVALAETSKALATVMKTQIRGTETAEQTMGILNATVGSGVMELSDLTAAMSTGLAPAARDLGLSLQDVGAAVAVMTARGVPAQVAAQRLGMLFLKMIPSGKKAQEAFGKLGIGLNELGDAMRSKGGLPKAIDILGESFQKLSKEKGPTEAIRVLTEAFPRGLVKTLLTMMGAREEYAKMVDSIGKNTEQFGEKVKLAAEGAAVEEENMKARIKAAMIELGEALEPVKLEFIEFFGMLANKFADLPKHTQKMIVMAVGIAAAIGPVVMIGGALMGMFAAMIPVVAALATPVGALVAAVVLLGTAMVAAKVAPAQFSAVLQKMGMSVESADKTVRGLAKAFDFIAAYVGTVVPAIAAHLHNVAKVIGDVVRVVTALIHGDWKEAWDALKDLAVDAMKAMWSGIKLLVAPIIGVLKGLGMDVKREALEIAISIVRPFENLPGPIGDQFTRARLAMLKSLSPARYEVAKLGLDIAEGLKDALIKGDPSPALQKNLSKLSKQMQAQNPQMRKDAIALAKEIVDAVPGGLDGLEGKVSPKVLKQMRTALAKADAAADAGVAAAQRIAVAIPSGFNGLSARVEAKVTAEITAGLNAATAKAGAKLSGSGPYQWTRHAIGEPMTEGIKIGVSKGLAGLATVIAKGLGEETKDVKKFTATAVELGKKYGEDVVKSVVSGMRSTTETPAQELRRKVHEAVQVDARTDTLARLYGSNVVKKVAEGLRKDGNLTVEELNKAMREGFLKKGEVEALSRRFGTNVMKQVIAGMKDHAPTAKSEAIAAARDIVQAMNQAVASARDSFKSAFGGVISAALAAFDEVASKWKPPHLKMIEAMDLQDQKDRLSNAIIQAGNELAAVNAEMAKKVAEGGTLTDEDKQKVLDAEQRLADAQKAQQRFNYEQLAAQEQADHDKEMEAKRTRLEARLNKIMQHYASEKELSKAEIAKMNKEIRDAMGEAGVDSKNTGQAISNQLALGIRSAINEVTKAVQELAKVLRRRLKLRSNAEEGELSDIESWWVTLGPMLAKQIDPNEVQKAAGTVGLAMKTGLLNPSKDVKDEWVKFGDKKDELVANLKLLQQTANASKEPLNKGIVEPLIYLRGAAKEGTAQVTQLDAALSALNGKVITTHTYHYIKTIFETEGGSPGGSTGGGPGGSTGGGETFPWQSPGTGFWGFAHGGVVPGRIGKAALAVVHGGEVITPPGGPLPGAGSIVINVQGSVISERDLFETVRRALLRNGMQNGRLGLV